MKLYLGILSFATASVAFAASNNGPVATVTSRAPFSVQGVEVPVDGATSWPVMAGDVVQTKSSAAEVRMKDGTRILVAPSSRFVVGSGDTRQTAATAARGPAVLRILNNGAVAFQPSASRAGGVNAPVLNDANTTQTLPSILALYGGTKSPLVEAIFEAQVTQSTVQTKAVGNTYYITGVLVMVGNGPLQPATFIITATGISIVPGTVGPTTPPVQIPPPLVSFTPPPPGGPPTGCAGITSPPPDVTPVAIKIPGVC